MWKYLTICLRTLGRFDIYSLPIFSSPSASERQLFRMGGRYSNDSPHRSQKDIMASNCKGDMFIICDRDCRIIDGQCAQDHEFQRFENKD